MEKHRGGTLTSSIRLTGFICAAALLVGLSCSKLNIDVPVEGGAGSAGNNGGAAGGTSGSSPIVQGGVGATGGGGSSGGAVCGPGTHSCSTACYGDHEVASCGTSCEPCPPIKGGTSTCDGTKCGGTCPSGQKLCHSECIAEGQSCTGSCPDGTHDCAGVCSDNTSVGSCGPTSCSACPVPPGATATCDGTKCNFTCGTKKRCGDQCGECCGDDDCRSSPGQVTVCDLATHKCKSSCPTGTKSCNDKCVPEGSCCKNEDCPPKSGQVGKCDSGTGQCTWSCGADTKPCNSACISLKGCCTNEECPGSFACVSNTCSTTMCRDGNQKGPENCENGRDDDCDGKTDCEDSDCPNGHACGSDKVCGSGSCNPCINGASCPQGACKQGRTSCATGTALCMADGNAPDGSDCGGGRACKGGACVTCGANGQMCCPGNGCNGGTCDNQVCCPAGQKNCGGRCQDCCSASDCAARANQTAACNGGSCSYTANCSAATCDMSARCEGDTPVRNTCNSSGQCVPIKQQACTGCQTCKSGGCVNACSRSQTCISDRCVDCGGEGQQCCAKCALKPQDCPGACGAGLACEPPFQGGFNVCRKCDFHGAPCCSGNSCSNGSLRCVYNVGNDVKRCWNCGFKGGPCCNPIQTEFMQAACWPGNGTCDATNTCS
jgi:hypothetical protein